MAYATAEDLAARFDIDIIGQLASDDRNRMPRDQILSHANVAVALLDASGDFDVKRRIGKRYSDEDLANLDANSMAHLKRIVCTIAMAHLFRRRAGIHEELAKQIQEEATEWMRRLQTGEDIFGIIDDTSHEDASVPQLNGPTSVQIRTRNFLAARMAPRTMPSIEERQPLDRG